MRWTWSSSTTSEIAGQTANPVCGCATLEPWSRLCPPRARKKGHARRFTVTHGATGVALDLCGRRSSGGGHFLCKQGVRLLPKLLPRPWTATDTGRQAWNIAPAGGHGWTVLDDLPMPTDQKVGGSSPCERAQVNGPSPSWQRPSC